MTGNKASWNPGNGCQDGILLLKLHPNPDPRPLQKPAVAQIHASGLPGMGEMSVGPWLWYWPRGARLCAKMKSSRIELHIVVVQSLSHAWLFETPWTACTGLPCPLAFPWAYSNSCPLSQWCHPTISSSVTPFSSRLQSFPASGSFSMSWLFASGGPKYWKFSFSSSHEYSGLIYFRIDLFDLLALSWEGLSRVFSSTPIRQHQFFSAQASLWSISHIHTWLLEKS